MPEKRIHIFYVNKIKTSLRNLKIAKEANDTNRIGTYSSLTMRWIDRADVIDEPLISELIEACKTDDSETYLRNHGWKVLEGFTS